MHLLRLPCSQETETARSETGLHRITSTVFFTRNLMGLEDFLDYRKVSSAELPIFNWTAKT